MNGQAPAFISPALLIFWAPTRIVAVIESAARDSGSFGP